MERDFGYNSQNTEDGCISYFTPFLIHIYFYYIKTI